MSFGHISDDVRRFIQDNIHSVEQLEVLLLLRNEPQKDWSAVEVSQRLFTVPTSAATRLEDLRSLGLIALSGNASQEAGSGQPHYRYQSHSSQTEQVIMQLDNLYRERKDTIIQLIFSRPPDRLNTFSNAFRIRRDD